MFFFLILPILIAGSLLYFNKKNIRYFYQLNRFDGQLLYLKVATAGFFILIASVVIAFTIKWQVPELKVVTYLHENFSIYKDENANRAAFWLILLSLLTILLGWITPYLMYFYEKISVKFSYMKIKRSDKIACPDCKRSQKSKTEYDIKISRKFSLIRRTIPDQSLKAFFLDAILNKDQVMVSLSCKKVYVGYVTSISEPNEKKAFGEHITLKILLSGFRNKDDASVSFLNDYIDIPAEDSSIIFAKENIELASKFNTNTYDKVNKNKGKNKHKFWFK